MPYEPILRPKIPEEEPDEIDYASQVSYFDSRNDPEPKKFVSQPVSGGIRPTIEEAIDAFNNRRDIRTDPYAYEPDYINDPNDDLHKEYKRIFNFGTKVGYNPLKFPKGRTASEIRLGLDKLDRDIHSWLANRG